MEKTKKTQKKKKCSKDLNAVFLANAKNAREAKDRAYQIELEHKKIEYLQVIDEMNKEYHQNSGKINTDLILQFIQLKNFVENTKVFCSITMKTIKKNIAFVNLKNKTFGKVAGTKSRISVVEKIIEICLPVIKPVDESM